MDAAVRTISLELDNPVHRSSLLGGILPFQKENVTGTTSDIVDFCINAATQVRFPSRLQVISTFGHNLR